jgi:hypothetical protein
MGFSERTLGGSGGDFLERGFVEEVNSPNQGLEGQEGEGDFIVKVCGDPLRGEEDSTDEDGPPEHWEDLLPFEGGFVGDDSVLNGKGPHNNVVEPPAAAREVVLKAVTWPSLTGPRTVVSAPKRMGIETGRARRRKDSV